MAEATRGSALTRTGKTRRKVECTPPNKKCGGRCIPPDWDCRLEGKGTNPELKVVKNDPLAGAASIQRGAKDVAKGVTTLDPSKVQRGRSSIIRGIVKIAPGNNLEEKNKLRKRLEEGSSAAFALTLVGILGVVGHRSLNKSSFYRERIGRKIDQAAFRAVNAVLDVTPGQRGRRNAIRSAATVAQIQTMRTARRGYALTSSDQRAAENLGRMGPLGFLGDRIGGNNSPLLADAKLRRTMRALATSEGKVEDFSTKATTQLFSTTTSGGHNLFSASAAQTYLNSEFSLGLGSVVNPPLQRRMGARLVNNPAAGLTLTSRKDAVIEGLTSRIQQWGGAMRSDMVLRGYTEDGQRITSGQIERYIREQALPIVRPYAASMGPNADVALSNYERQLRNFIGAGGNPTSARGLARQTYLSTVKGYDSYFADVVDRFSGGPMARSSPFADGKVALAKYLRGSETYNPTRGTGYTRVVSREHANLLVNDWYHRRQEGKTPYTVTPATAQRIAQVMQRSPELPSPEDALATLRRSGLRVQYAPTAAAPRRYGERSEAQTLASMMRQTRVNRRGERVPRYASRAAALRALRAQQQNPERGDDASGERADFQQGSAQGKPCGKTHIPKEKKCHTPVVTQEQVVKIAQTAALAIYIGATAIEARQQYKVAKIRNMVNKSIDKGLDGKAPKPWNSNKLTSALQGLKGQNGVDPKVIDQVATFTKKAGIGVDLQANRAHFPATFGYWNPQKPNVLNVPYFGSRSGEAPEPNMSRVARIGAATINRPQPLGLFRRWGVSNGASIGSSDQFMMTTIHELGHAIHGRVGFSTPSALRINGTEYKGKALTQMLSRSITGYGSTDLRYGRYETFAEYFSMYVTNGATLKRRNPVAWAWTKSIVDRATSVDPQFTDEMRNNVLRVVRNTNEGRSAGRPMFDAAMTSPAQVLAGAKRLATMGDQKGIRDLLDRYEGTLTVEQLAVIGSLYETAGIYAFTNGQTPSDIFPEVVEVSLD